MKNPLLWTAATVCVMGLCAPAIAAPEAMVGKWHLDVDGEAFELVLGPDGKGSLADEQFGYAATGDTITLTFPDESTETVRYRLEGDRLIVTTEDETELTFRRGAGAETPPVEGDGPPLLFLRQVEGGTEICSLDTAARRVSVLSKVDAILTGPAVWGQGPSIVYPVRHPIEPRLTGIVNGEPFDVPLPTDANIQVRHPSISRDGKLLAFTIRSSRHVGTIRLLDEVSRADKGTQMMVGSWFKVVSVNLETGEQQAIYYDDDLVPEVLKKRGLGPVFSPTEDILVYADNRTLYVCDALTGRELRRLETPEITSRGWTGRAYVSEYSGLAFSPDGQVVAYLSQGEADIAISPHMLILMNVADGSSARIDLPENVSGWSPQELTHLDFSPDGAIVIFSGTTRDGTADYQPAPRLVGVFLETGACVIEDAAGPAYDPVWKGR